MSTTGTPPNDPIKYLAPESESIKAAMKIGDKVKVFTHRRIMQRIFIGFEPTGGDLNPAKGIGLIYYPGALVTPEKYSPMARALAELGYHVAICNFSLNLPVTDYRRADRVIGYDPWKGAVKRWVISGHSLGGVMACKYANEFANDEEKFGSVPLSGVAFHASYSQDEVTLKGLGLKIYSIYGDKDGLTTAEDIEKSKTILSEDTEFICVVGGNHTQYYYSKSLQKNDNEATISLNEQQIEIRKHTHKLLVAVDSNE